MEPMSIVSSLLRALLGPGTTIEKNPRERIPVALAAAVIKRAGGRCELCGRSLEGTRTNIHHWTAVTFGGGDEFGNLAHVHARCNLRVGIMGKAAAIKLATQSSNKWLKESVVNSIYRKFDLSPPRHRELERAAAKRAKSKPKPRTKPVHAAMGARLARGEGGY